MKKTRDKRKDFRKSLKVLFDSVIQIGAVGGREGDAPSNNDLLAIHELTNYGRGVRAPITKTVNDGGVKSKLKSNIKNLIAVNFDEKSGTIKAEVILDGIGSFLKQSIQKTILAGVDPDILPETKEASSPRRVDVPLIHEGIMLDNITWGVRLA